MRRAALAVLVGALALSAPAHASLPQGFVGLYGDDAFFGSDDYRAAQFDAQARLGVTTMRQPLEWSRVERSPGDYDFSDYDDYFADAARAGIQILPFLVAPPTFRSSRPPDSTSPAMYPPTSNADYAAFVDATVRHYGPTGSFWLAHPELPYRPVRAWQLWNEPNIPNWWRSGPSARKYVALLRAGARAIHVFDPNAEIVTAGLPNSHLGVPFLKYLDQMYKAGAKGTFNTLAIHPYSANVAGLLALVEQARAVMNRHHDHARIWITEFGWSTAGDASAFRVGTKGQADRVAAALPALTAERRVLRLRGFVLFKWKDAVAPPGTVGDPWPLHAGLLDANGAPKRAFRVFARVVEGLRRSARSWHRGSARPAVISKRTVQLSPLGYAAVGMTCRSHAFGACAGTLRLRAARGVHCGGRARPAGAALGSASFRVLATPAIVPVRLNGIARRLARCARSVRVRASASGARTAHGSASSARSVVFTIHAR